MHADAAGSSSSAPVQGARFIDPKVLASIGNLDLLARIVVEGFVSGMHRAVYRGVSTEFAEHRAYAPGDDVRHLDWKLYARTDRLYLKTYEAETNADLVIALDISRSMDFAGKGLNKLDYARYLSASLTHLAGRQRDRIGLGLLDQTLAHFIPPSARHRDRVMSTLETLKPGLGSELQPSLESLGAALSRRGVIVVISDFYLPADDMVRALSGLKVRGHDVIAIHILDPLERDMDLGEAQVLEDSETGQRVPVLPETQRKEYRQLMDDHVNACAKGCGDHGIDYACFDTAQPLDHLLFRYLSQRARLAGGRR